MIEVFWLEPAGAGGADSYGVPESPHLPLWAESDVTLDFSGQSRHLAGEPYPARVDRVDSSQDRIREIISRDLDPAFLRAASIRVGWAYDCLFERLEGEPALGRWARESEFGRQRGFVVSSALASVARDFGIPFEERRLDCNGQVKLLIKAGRVILIQEPMLTITEHPRMSDYKRNLAETHALTFQYELDLGDRPLSVKDWSGCILAVLLHGSSGPSFTREDKSLGGLALAVPDAAYLSWQVRVDLLRIAKFGRDDTTFASSEAIEQGEAIVQPDNVRVGIRDKAGSGRMRR